MKLFYLLILSFFLTAGVTAQESNVPAGSGAKFEKTFDKISLTATAGTGYYSGEWSDLSHLSLGEFSISYRLNSRFSLGIGVLGHLLCDLSYLDDEGILVIVDDDDDDDEDEMEEEDEDEEDDCDFEFGENILGLFNYQLFENLPFYLQAGAGYSRDAQAPVYTAMLGYNQKIFGGLGITGGLRYSDIVSTGNTRDFVASSGGLKAELGLFWNF